MMVGWEASEAENEGSHSGLSQEVSNRDGEETEEQLTGLSPPLIHISPRVQYQKGLAGGHLEILGLKYVVS